MKEPVISVITVAYNDSKNLETTMMSVLNQHYDSLEYIVIDGGSKDGSLDIIKKYSSRLSCWVSEPDKGIYDAMNKGINFSHGKWLNFMNAGDTFFDDYVLKNVMANGPFDESVKVLYGNVALKFRNQPDIIKHLDDIDKRIVQFSLNHQSTIIDGDWMRKTLYDTTYKICADANFFNETAKAGYAFAHVPVVISSYEASNGVSARNLKQMYREFEIIKGTKRWSRDWVREHIKLMFMSTLTKLPFGMGDRLLFAYIKKRVATHNS